MTTEFSLEDAKKQWLGTFRAYAIGFAFCLFLTTVSFALVVLKGFAGFPLVASLLALALLQATVQLRFFLHLGQAHNHRWEKLVFFFMIVLLLVVVIGSLWIMQDLDERMMMGMHD